MATEHRPIDPAEAQADYEYAEREALDKEQHALEDEAHTARQMAEDLETTWGEQDLTQILAGDLEPEPPTILHRTDGRALLYHGKTHSFVGEFEGGKSWAATAAVAEVILLEGAHVIYIDFEDSAKTFARRLRQLGVPSITIKRYAHYIRPTKPLTTAGGTRALVAVGARHEPALVVIDGVTEVMALHNLNPNDGADVAKFLDLMPRRWDTTGAAVVLIDHVVKSKDDRGRYAIGSQHKMSGVNGASYRFEVEGDGLSPGRHGKVKVTILKDREGSVREFAGSGKVVGTMHLRPAPDRGPKDIDITIEPPSYTEDRDRGEDLKGSVCRWLATQTEPVSQNAVERGVGGNRWDVRAALAELVVGGLVKFTPGPRGAKLHSLVVTAE